MKILSPGIKAFLLLLIAISCKKDQVIGPQITDITATPCKLKDYNARYTVDYDADNKIDKVNEAVFNGPSGSGFPSGYRPLWRFQYEHDLLRRIIYEIPPLPDTNTVERHTRYKFDYGPNGIERVYYYDFDLVYWFDFKYDSFNKPTSMIQYLNNNQGGSGGDDMKAITSMRYEYDSNGNLVKEYYEELNRPASPYNYVATHKYDTSPNSVKVFECFNFTYKSAASVFSTNNLTETEYIFADQKTQTNTMTRFDPETNLVKHYWTYSYITWDCK